MIPKTTCKNKNNKRIFKGPYKLKNFFLCIYIDINKI